MPWTSREALLQISAVLLPGLAFSREPRLPSDLCPCPAFAEMHFPLILVRIAGVSCVRRPSQPVTMPICCGRTIHPQTSAAGCSHSEQDFGLLRQLLSQANLLMFAGDCDKEPVAKQLPRLLSATSTVKLRKTARLSATISSSLCSLHGPVAVLNASRLLASSAPSED